MRDILSGKFLDEEEVEENEIHHICQAPYLELRVILTKRMGSEEDLLILPEDLQ